MSKHEKLTPEEQTEYLLIQAVTALQEYRINKDIHELLFAKYRIEQILANDETDKRGVKFE